MNDRATIPAFVLILTTASAATAQNLIVNDDFAQFVPNNGSGPGWTSSGINVSGGYQGSRGNPAQYFFLNDSAPTTATPTLTQAITGLQVSSVYLLTGDYDSIQRNTSPSGATKSFVVDLDGQTLFNAGPTPTVAGAPGNVWASFRLAFVSQTASSVLRLRAEMNDSDNDFGLDNISLVPLAALSGSSH